MASSTVIVEEGYCTMGGTHEDTIYEGRKIIKNKPKKRVNGRNNKKSEAIKKKMKTTQNVIRRAGKRKDGKNSIKTE